MPRICIFGDSITWGSYDLEKGGWVERLKVDSMNSTEGETAVYNVGISGDKVGDVLRRFDAEMKARRTEVVQLIVLAIGINDSPHGDYEGTDLGEFEQSFRNLIGMANDYSGKLIIVTPTNVDDFHPAQTYKKRKDLEIKKYVDIIIKITKENKLPLVDVFGLMTKEDLKIDGLHPLASGHEKIYQEVKKVIDQCLK